MNIQTLVALNTGKDARKVILFDFGHGLAMGLITPHLYSRELSGVPQKIILKMHLATSDDCFLRDVMNVCEPSQSLKDELPHRGQPAKKGKRCGECMRDIYTGGADSKEKRKRVNKLATSTSHVTNVDL